MDTRSVLEALRDRSMTPAEALAALRGQSGAAPATEATHPAPEPVSGGDDDVPSRAASATRPAPRMRGDAIAVIGMSGRYAAASDLNRLWEVLRDGEDAVREVPAHRRRGAEGEPPARMGFLDDIDTFDPYFFRISPAEAEAMDPAHRMFLEEAYHAFQDAGYASAALRGRRCGVYAGLSGNEYQLMGRLGGSTSSSVTGASNAIAAGRLSYFLDLRGPALTIDTACSSSLVCVHLACQALRHGEIDLALAGGVATYLSDESYRPMLEAGMLSSDGACKAFSDDADGFVPAEGAGAVVLKRLDDAERDGDQILGVIVASAVNQDGHTNGITAPSLASQQELVSSSYAAFGIDPASISYAELHGTGTRLGDPVELEALAGAWRSLGDEGRHCAIGSVKSNLGHVSAAAGVAGLHKILLCLRHRSLVPTLHVRRPNTHFDFENSPFRINTETAPWTAAPGWPRRAALSSFGFSGTNAHLVVEEHPLPPRPAAPPSPQLVVLSAATEEQLRSSARALHADLTGRDVALDDVAFTLQTGRDHLAHRLAVVADTVEGLCESLRDYEDSSAPTGTVWTGHVKRGQGDTPATAVASTTEHPEPEVLAERWVRGDEVEWSALHRTRTPHRTSLPGYPFEKVRAWFTGDSVAPGPSRPADIRQSGRGGTVQVRVGPGDVLAAQHTVGGVPTLPASALLDLVVGAWIDTGGGLSGESVRFTDVVWAGPVSCPEPVDLRVTLEPGHGGAQRFVVGSGDDIVHCHGSLGPLGDQPPAHIDIEAVRRRCSRTFESCNTSESASGGVHYGPLFRALRSLQWGDDEAVGMLTANGEDAGRDVDPALLDSAWQAVGPFLPDAGKHGREAAWVPFAADQIAVLGRLPRSGHVHVLRRSVQSFDVTVTDDVGRAVIVCAGLAFADGSRPPGRVRLAPRWENAELLTNGGSEQILHVVDSRASLPLAPQCGPEDLTAALSTKAPTTLVLHGPEAGADPVSSARAAVSFVHSVVPTLSTVPGPTPRNLVHVQREGQEPAASAVAAYLRVVSREDPRLTTRCIVLDSAAGPVVDEVVRRETAAPAQDRWVRYVNGRRQRRRLSEVSPSSSSAPTVRRGGLYLITGGLGGVGIATAEHILACGGRVILTGRRPLAAVDSPRTRRLLGEGAVYLPADVSRAQDVSVLVERIHAEHGVLAGVLHAAGVLRDGLVPSLTDQDFDEAWSAKVDGAVALDRELADESLDWFVLCSSASVEIGTVGQAAYCSANAFMDAFAGLREQARRDGHRSGVTVSIGWPYRSDGGMRLSGSHLEDMEQSWGVVPMSTSEATASFEQALQLGHPHVLPLLGDAEVIRSAFGATRDGGAARDTASVEPDAGDAARAPEEGALGVAARRLLCQVVADHTHAEPRRVEHIGEFGALGIDSIVMMQLTRDLERTFGLLPKTLFFEHSDIDELAAYFVENHAAELATLVEPSEGHTEQEATAAAVAGQNDNDAASGAAATMSSRREQVPAVIDGTRPDDIAIVGISARYPRGEGLNAFWENLRQGIDCITGIPEGRWDHEAYASADYVPGKAYARWGGFLEGIEDFDPLFFGITPREASRLDPQVRIFLEEAWHALDDAGVTRRDLDRRSVGVFAATMYSMHELLEPEGGHGQSPLSSSLAAVANRVSYFMDFGGPSLTVDTMCSSSLTAVHLACESIRRGECSAALAGGVNLTVHPNKLLLLNEGRFAARDGRCRAFGAGGSGYVPAEGVGVLLLKPLQAAIDDGHHIRAVIRASATNSGGRTSGFTVPNPKAQTALVRSVLDRAGVDARTIGHVEAHGTGTELGDPIEVAALTTAFRQDTADEQFCSLASVKSVIGHCEGAAGVAALTKVALELEHGELVPTLHAEELNPHIDFERSPFAVQRERTPWTRGEGTESGCAAPRRALVNAFGAGGSNTSVLVEEYRDHRVKSPAPAPAEHLFVFSAADKERLAAVVEQYIELLDGSGSTAPAFDEIRTALRERLAEMLCIPPERVDTDEDISALVPDVDDLRRFTSWVVERFGVEMGSVLPVSGTVDTAARRLLSSGGGHPTVRPMPDLEAMAQTLQLGREPMEERVAILAGTHRQLSEALKGLRAGRPDDDRCVRGTVGSGSSGPEVSEVESSVRTGDLVGLARAWVNGAEIPWRRLHEGRDIRRVPLPVYPFARERFWAVRVGSPGPAGEGGRLHPLLHRNTSSLDGIRFTTTLTGSEPTLRDHRVDGVMTLPAAAQMEMVQTAAAQVLPGVGRPVIDDIIWVAPVMVVATTDLEIRCSAGTDGGVEVEICSATDDVLHCSARLHLTTVPPVSTASLAKLKQICSQRVLDHDEFYDRFEAMGLDYGVSHRVVGEVRQGSAGVLASLSVPASDPLLMSCDLHPALLDGALQATIALPSGSAASQVELPFAASRVVQHRRCTARMWVHLRPAHRPTRQRKVDITLYDERGDVAVELFDVAFRAAANLEEADAGVLALAPTWAPSEAGAGSPVLVDRWVVVMATDRAEDRLALRAVGAQVAQPVSAMPEVDFVERATGLFELLKDELDEPTTHRLIQVVVRGPVSDANTALLAEVQTLRMEDPTFMVQLICVPEDTPAAQMAHWVASERTCPVHEFVSFEGGVRRARSWSPVPLPPASASPWHDDGTWLVTGGAGGLGRIVARDIARASRGARILLVGRSQPSSETDTVLRELENLGAVSAYAACDIASRSELSAVLDTFTRRHGPLSGVVHCAGITRDRLMVAKSVDDFRAVLRPKTTGLSLLDEMTAGQPLRLFLVFSSLAGAIGNVGQVDYATANAFMDRFAARRSERVARGTRQGHTVSIGWPLWADGGMDLTPSAREFLTEIGMTPIDERRGLDILAAAVESGREHVVPLHGEVGRLREWFDRHGHNTTTAPADGPAPMTSGPAPIERVVEALVELIADATEIPADKLDPHRTLDRYGITSVMIVDLGNRLEGLLSVPVSKSLFFDSDSILDLAANLLEAYPSGCSRWVAGGDGAESPVARPDDPTGAAELPPPTESPTPVPAVIDDSVAIIGLSGRYPRSPDLDTFWTNLREGRDCVSEIPPERWDHTLYGEPARRSGGTDARWGGFLEGCTSFDSLFFGISPSEAELMDPQERIFLEAAYHAVEDAGYTPALLSSEVRDGISSRVGVYVGAMYLDYQLYGAQAQTRGDLYTTNGSAASIANRVSYALGLHGPSLTLDSMCSSSLVAVHLAVQALRSGDADVAIAGGVNLSLHPNKFLTLGVNRFSSPTGRCHAFGAGADGYVPSEGVGVLVLKPLHRALADGDHIHGVIKGTAVNQDGRTNGFTAPSSRTQAAVVRRAVERAGIDVGDVSYVEAHGTGTQLGDPVEVSALDKVFGGSGRAVMLGSVKSNIGHCESAAGVAGITKVLLQLRHDEIVPSIHSDELTPEIDFGKTPFTVVRSLTPWSRGSDSGRSGAGGPARYAGVSAFGAGGTNAHVVLADPPEVAHEPVHEDSHVIVLSAQTTESLERQVAHLESWLQKRRLGPDELVAVADTLQSGREAFEERTAVVVGSGDELLRRLRSWPDGWERSDGLSLEAPPTESEVWAAADDKHRLAEWWVGGVDIDWQRLRGRRMRRISLPGYAFAVRHHWRPEPELLVPARGEGRTHADARLPLLGVNESTIYEQRFVATYSVADLPEDTAGAPTLPFGLCLAMARHAAGHSLERDVTLMRDIAWTGGAPNGDEVTITTRVLPTDDGVRVEVHVAGEPEPRMSAHADFEETPAPGGLRPDLRGPERSLSCRPDLPRDRHEADLLDVVVMDALCAAADDDLPPEEPRCHVTAYRVSGDLADARKARTSVTAGSPEGAGVDVLDHGGCVVAAIRGVTAPRRSTGVRP